MSEVYSFKTARLHMLIGAMKHLPTEKASDLELHSMRNMQKSVTMLQITAALPNTLY